jgi:thioredoxin 1
MVHTIETLTDATFDEAIAGSELPVIVDVWAEWCGPCHTLAPILDSIAEDFADRVSVYKLNADEHPGIAQRFNAMSLPTLLVFRDGQLVRSLVGARGRGRLLEDLADVIS